VAWEAYWPEQQPVHAQRTVDLLRLTIESLSPEEGLKASALSVVSNYYHLLMAMRSLRAAEKLCQHLWTQWAGSNAIAQLYAHYITTQSPEQVDESMARLFPSQRRNYGLWYTYASFLVTQG